MKALFISLIIYSYLFSVQERTGIFASPGLIVKTIYKGSYNSVYYDSTKCSSCWSLYYLVDFKLINITDSTIRFWSFIRGPEQNIVLDTKEMTIVPNFCISDKQSFIELEPKQELSIPLMLEARIPINKEVKIGYIYLDYKSIPDEEYIPKLKENNESHKNVIWSEPINFGWSRKHTMEIKEKSLENLSHF